MQDTEAEVRRAISARVVEFARNLPKDVQWDGIFKHLLPQVQVRAARPYEGPRGQSGLPVT